MLKLGKVAIPFTRLACVAPRSWAFLATLPSVPIATVTSPVKLGTRLPDESSAVTSTWKVSDSTVTAVGGWIVKASCVAGGMQATLKVVRAVSFARTVTVRGLSPLTLQLSGTPPSAARRLPAAMPVAGTPSLKPLEGLCPPSTAITYPAGGFYPHQAPAAPHPPVVPRGGPPLTEPP